jgi:hypothetical protein
MRQQCRQQFVGLRTVVRRVDSSKVMALAMARRRTGALP